MNQFGWALFRLGSDQERFGLQLWREKGSAKLIWHGGDVVAYSGLIWVTKDIPVDEEQGENYEGIHNLVQVGCTLFEVGG